MYLTKVTLPARWGHPRGDDEAGKTVVLITHEQDIAEFARRVAERMDFPFYVIDLRADFAARVR